MAWIESHQSLGTHRKLLALCEELRLPDYAAIGMLHCLWWWALDNAPQGDLAGIYDRNLAGVSHWSGKPEAWRRALVSAGWPDEQDGRRTIHDWQDYAGKLIEKRGANAARQRRFRQMKSKALRNADMAGTSPSRNGATVPIQRKHTKRKRTI